MSEEEGSMDSGNGNGTQKFPNRDHSPGEASTSSANDEEGGSPYSSSQASPRHAPPPQHFSRVTKDRESSCARTDLVYLKKAPVPTKVRRLLQLVSYTVLFRHLCKNWYSCGCNFKLP